MRCTGDSYFYKEQSSSPNDFPLLPGAHYPASTTMKTLLMIQYMNENSDFTVMILPALFGEDDYEEDEYGKYEEEDEEGEVGEGEVEESDDEERNKNKTSTKPCSWCGTVQPQPQLRYTREKQSRVCCCCRSARLILLQCAKCPELAGSRGSCVLGLWPVACGL